MTTNYPLQSDHVVSLEITYFFTSVSPNKYKISRISTENEFCEIGHRMVEVGRGLLRCSKPASFSRQDALLYKCTE